LNKPPRITIGIPCFHGVPAETLEDYMRFAFYLGRRYTEYDLYLCVKSKSEQFRARNSIIEAALQVSSDYIFMLDDDHVIDWINAMHMEPGVHKPYEFLRTLINHMEKDKKIGLCGALFYQRGGDCRPVVMKEAKDGGYYWMRDDEIISGLQEVAVQGGGNMLIRAEAILKIGGTWFEPEFQHGTDIQICEKVRKAGYKVMCDTSLELGHVKDSREVVTSRNRHRIAMKTPVEEGLAGDWKVNSALALYRMDAEEYTKMPMEKMTPLFEEYNQDMLDMTKHENLEGYYATRGISQLARQVIFHHAPHMVDQMDTIHRAFKIDVPAHGIDFGCGSAPVSFELAMRGHTVDFIDVDGSYAYEFTKWRAKKRGLNGQAKFEWTGGPYDYALFLDSIEHLEEKKWKEVLDKVIMDLKDDGCIITNYFLNVDTENPEHISMDKKAVEKFLVERGVYPLNKMLWIKRDLTKGGAICQA